MSEADRECINAAALAWVEHGGDAEGIAWTWREIQERVREIQKEQADD